MAEVASLVGDSARANMLCALLGGRALTATELAFAAGVSPQTASGHLGKLLTAKLLLLRKQGRHRYYTLSGPHVGHMLESIMAVALTAPPRFQPKSKRDNSLRRARTCYDHIAGLLGVGLAERLIEREFVILGTEAGEVTPKGEDFLMGLGVRSHSGASQTPHLLPPMHRLDRAGAAYRRSGRGGLGELVLRIELDQARG